MLLCLCFIVVRMNVTTAVFFSQSIKQARTSHFILANCEGRCNSMESRSAMAAAQRTQRVDEGRRSTRMPRLLPALSAPPHSTLTSAREKLGKRFRRTQPRPPHLQLRPPLRSADHLAHAQFQQRPVAARHLRSTSQKQEAGCSASESNPEAGSYAGEAE